MLIYDSASDINNNNDSDSESSNGSKQPRNQEPSNIQKQCGFYPREGRYAVVVVVVVETTISALT